MRHSFFLPIIDGRITFSREVLNFLGLGDEGIIYALPSKNENDGAVISVIPPEIWLRAYRVVVHSSHRPGSLRLVAQAIADNGYNIISAWAAGISAHGELCITAIIEKPIQSSKDEIIKEHIDFSDEIRDMLATKLEENTINPLSIYKEKFEHVKTPYQTFYPIYVSKCNKLSLFSEMQEKSVSYWGRIENLILNLKKVTARGNSIDTLWDKLKGEITPKLALITPDTEERYSQLFLLDKDLDLREFNCKIIIESTEYTFAGCFEAVLAGLHKEKYNIYSARNVLLEKTLPNDINILNPIEYKPTEKAEISICVDVRNSGLVQSESIKSAIHECISNSLKDFSNETRSAFIEENSFNFQLVGRRWKCFLATNFKDEKTAKWTLMLYDRLVSLGLDPVHVVTSDPADKTLYEQASEMLKCCPMLVALYVPEEYNEYVKELPEYKGRHASSDWVVFEQSFMMAQNRSAFQISHSDVRVPKFVPGRDYKFKDDISFEKSLNQIVNAIKAHFLVEKWAEEVRDAEENVKILGGFPNHGNLYESLKAMIKD